MILTTNGYYRIRIKRRGDHGSSFIGSYRTREEAEKRLEGLTAPLKNKNFYSVNIEEMSDGLRYEFNDKKQGFLI
tara:strand:- start:789 stop:1013 length:225 start_codon:yes stop_codon:yes gene_type:complete